MLYNLKKLRKSFGISQRFLAEEIGLSQQSINKYENHDIEPDIETLIKFADFFGTSVDYIIGHSSSDSASSAMAYCLTPLESKALCSFRKLNDDQKLSVCNLLIAMTK